VWSLFLRFDKLLFEEEQKQKVKEKKLAQNLHHSQLEKEK